MVRASAMAELQSRVGSIAEWHRLRVLAGAPRDRFRLLDDCFLRFKSGALVRSIAEWLRLRSSAGAPPVHTRFHLLHDRKFLKDDWFSHRSVYGASLWMSYRTNTR